MIPAVLPAACARPRDPRERVAVARVVVLAGDAERLRQVVRADEEDVDAVEPRRSPSSSASAPAVSICAIDDRRLVGLADEVGRAAPCRSGWRARRRGRACRPAAYFAASMRLRGPSPRRRRAGRGSRPRRRRATRPTSAAAQEGTRTIAGSPAPSAARTIDSIDSIEKKPCSASMTRSRTPASASSSGDALRPARSGSSRGAARRERTRARNDASLRPSVRSLLCRTRLNFSISV